MILFKKLHVHVWTVVGAVGGTRIFACFFFFFFINMGLASPSTERQLYYEIRIVNLIIMVQ